MSHPDDSMDTLRDRLSPRAYNILRREDVHTVRDFLAVQEWQMEEMRNMNGPTIVEITALQTAIRNQPWQRLHSAVPYRNGKPVPEHLPADTTLWMNDKYVVHRRVLPADDPDAEPAIHLSIRDSERSAAHDWRDFQRIKNQLAGEEYEAVEIYPAESRKVDTANQYHLFCFPFRFPFGLGTERMVSNQAATGEAEPGAVQRDNEEVDGPLNTADEVKAWIPRAGIHAKITVTEGDDDA